MLIEGERICPPEDVGGVWGYVEYLEAIADPKHEQHDDFVEWRGSFDAEAFDAEKTTKRVNLERQCTGLTFRDLLLDKVRVVPVEVQPEHDAVSTHPRADFGIQHRRNHPTPSPSIPQLWCHCANAASPDYALAVLALATVRLVRRTPQ
ncbi:MAG: hypothetical protein O3A00_14155 [Planctomycetota bacterium]|nr:hypothetical protein [Planctomycetota bacterium]